MRQHARLALAQVGEELGALRRRLRAAQEAVEAADRRRNAEREATAEERSDRPTRRSDRATESLPGLRLTTVTDELASYFGEESEGGLLVLEADSSWDPIQQGDVILRVNGARASAGLLRDVLDSRRESRVEVLRRRRSITLTLEPRG